MAPRTLVLLVALVALAVPAAIAQDGGNTGQRLFPSDTSVVSDSARSYKSGSPALSMVSFSDSVEYISAGVALLLDSALLGDSARVYASARITADALSISDGVDARLPLPPMMVRELPSFSDRATATVLVPPSPIINRGGSGITGVTLAAIHGVWWNVCSDDPHVLITAAPGDAKLSVMLERGGSSTKAQLVGTAPTLLSAGLWKAPIAQSDSEITITARMATSLDEQTFVPSSCTGSSSYTPLHVPGPLDGVVPDTPQVPADDAVPASSEPVEPTVQAESSPTVFEPSSTQPDPAPESSQSTGDIKISDGVMWEVTPAPDADLTGEPEVALTGEPAVDLTGEPTVMSAEPSSDLQSESLLPIVLAVGAAAAIAAVVAWRMSARRGSVRQAQAS